MEFTTENTQKTVKIVPAKFQDAVNLKKAVLSALKDNQIDLNSLTDKSDYLHSLINAIISLDISDKFDKAVFKCLESCIYDGFYKITPQLFDDKPETREDYYQIITNCAEVNLRPFFKSLVSEFSIRFKQTSESPAQE